MEPQRSRESVSRLYQGFDVRISQSEAIQPASPVRGATEFTRLAMNERTGTGHWDVLRLHDDLLICVADSYYHDHFTFEVHPPEDLISMRFLLSGKLQLQAGRMLPMTLESRTASMLAVSAVRDHAVCVKGRERLASLTLHFHWNELASLIGMDDGELPEMLRAFEGGDARSRCCSVPLTAAMKNGVLDIVNAPFSGTLRRRYLEAKVTELLCLFVDSVEAGCRNQDRSGALLRTDREQLYRAREVLSDAFLDPPSIAELARAVGINRTKLQSSFKEFFGTTIFEFCQHKRMALARELLQDGAMSVHEVAEAVGYSHPTNFTAAFRRQFKQPPSHMRLRGRRF